MHCLPAVLYGPRIFDCAPIAQEIEGQERACTFFVAYSRVDLPGTLSTDSMLLHFLSFRSRKSIFYGIIERALEIRAWFIFRENIEEFFNSIML